MTDWKIRAAQLKLEKHRSEKEVYRVDFAGGTSPRLASSETLTGGSITVIRYRGTTATDVTTEFSTGGGASITGTVATGAQASSAVEFTLAAATGTEQDADEIYYLRVSASTAARDMLSLHKLAVSELGDVGAP